MSSFSSPAGLEMQEIGQKLTDHRSVISGKLQYYRRFGIGFFGQFKGEEVKQEKSNVNLGSRSGGKSFQRTQSF